ncbi:MULTISPECIES: DUF397 domain-containing protein [Micromonospora]|uniref:DUF397 domain-containing protein n=1 Tax=Micromonospora carbonacea TaxID=47853 RepID=A0A1C5AS01_9ACTN|nr:MULTISPECIES: DUF397 domain-containing protein [Micromonospora]WFE60236.1 DUF397 domain-containing protein [Micromonospora sp. WMMD712]SCF48025.1 protein of unknown function (DUF397) [Micromonospora carbonacea]
MERNAWRKSTRSGNNGQCVEVCNRGHLIDVRDSKAPESGMLSFEAAAWGAFVGSFKAEATCG